MALKQSSRLLKLHTPLGDDKLLLISLKGEERMSRLFSFELEMISDDNQIDAQQIVGKNVTFSVDLRDGSPRYFNGFVNQFLAKDEDEEGRRNYSAEVVPWLWFLTQTTDCRIFQNKPGDSPTNTRGLDGIRMEQRALPCCLTAITCRNPRIGLCATPWVADKWRNGRLAGRGLP